MMAPDEANAAKVRFANYLKEYGIYTVNSRDWYYERHTGRGFEINTVFPSKDPDDDAGGDTWVNAADGTQYVPNRDLRERIFVFCVGDQMHYAIIGPINQLLVFNETGAMVIKMC